MRTRFINGMLLSLLLAGCQAMTINFAHAQQYQLISVNTPWRYNRENLELGTAWRAPAYDDTIASWEGPSNILFGYETTPVEYSSPGASIGPQTFKTMFADPLTDHPYVTNYYFRTHLFIPDIPADLLAVSTLLTTNYIDDGCIYYLNGMEILRYNMPAGPVAAATYAFPALAEGYSATANETIFIRTNGATNLVLGGDNVLAVELHNATNSSTDEVFGMTLTLVVPEPLVITSQPVGQSNVIGSSPITLSVGVTGSNPSYQWYTNGVKIPGATFPTNVVSVLQTNAGVNYYVVVTNILGSVTSSLARVSVVTDNFPILLLSALAGGGVPLGTPRGNQVILNFSKTVSRNSASSNMSNYAITILGATSVLTLTNVAIASSFVRLTAATDFIYGTNYVLTVYNVTGTNQIPLQPNPTQIGIGLIKSNPPPVFTALITTNQLWDWNENGMDLGTAWRAPDFVEDANWGSGNGILYFDTSGFKPACFGGPGLTISQGPTTYYFRAPFVVPPEIPSSGILLLRHFIDDGAVFYLNGVEIDRFNMPLTSILYTTIPLSKVSTPACHSDTLSITNLIVTGTNLLAVEVHEFQGLSDPDVYFGMELGYTTNFSILATNTSPLPPKLNLVTLSPSNEVVTWSADLGGLYWGLEFNTNLVSDGWTALPVASPYTNSTGTGRIFFRAKAK